MQKLAVLPFLNVKSLIYLNKSCTNTFCRWRLWTQRKWLLYLFMQSNNTCISCRWCERGNIYRTAFKSAIAIFSYKLMVFQMISILNQITNFRGNSYRARLPQRVANSCHVIQSLIFMTLGYMGDTHTNGIPVQFMIFFDFVISAWMLQFYIHSVNWWSLSTFTNVHEKCNTTALIFLKGSGC